MRDIACVNNLIIIWFMKKTIVPGAHERRAGFIGPQGRGMRSGDHRVVLAVNTLASAVYNIGRYISEAFGSKDKLDSNQTLQKIRGRMVHGVTYLSCAGLPQSR